LWWTVHVTRGSKEWQIFHDETLQGNIRSRFEKRGLYQKFFVGKKYHKIQKREIINKEHQNMVMENIKTSVSDLALMRF